MNSIRKSNIVTYDMTRFAGRIGKGGFTFLSFMKITISLSLFLALVMILV